MSPQSRARKKKAAAEVAEPEQGITGFFKEALRDFGTLGPEPDLLELEVLAADVAGAWWDHPDGDDVGFELIDHAGQKTSPGAAALLAAMRVVAPTEELRDSADAALRAVVGRGIPEPDWAGRLGEVGVGECWQLGDVYGDSASLLACFGYGEQRHALLALVKFTDGALPDVAVVDNPDEVLADMREQAAEYESVVTLQEISPARLHRLLADGLDVTDKLDDVEVTEDFVRFRALAVTRCRALPDPEPAPEPEAVGDWTAVADEFLRDNPELPDDEATRACVRLLVEFGEQIEPARPLRVSPEKVLTFLEEWRPEHGEETDDETLAAVVLAWVHWAGTRQGLPEVALAELVEGARDSLEGTDEMLELYLDGSEDPEDPAELTEILDRRMFAVPETVTEIGDEELELEPGEEEQRRLLVIGEHPEYHGVLAEDGEPVEGQRCGLEPALYLALKIAVVDQLWNGEPPEVWTVARELRDEGVEREEILDRLVEVLASVRADDGAADSGDGELRFDVDDYCQALAALF